MMMMNGLDCLFVCLFVGGNRERKGGRNDRELGKRRSRGRRGRVLLKYTKYTKRDVRCDRI